MLNLLLQLHREQAEQGSYVHSEQIQAFAETHSVQVELSRVEGLLTAAFSIEDRKFSLQQISGNSSEYQLNGLANGHFLRCELGDTLEYLDQLLTSEHSQPEFTNLKEGHKFVEQGLVARFKDRVEQIESYEVDLGPTISVRIENAGYLICQLEEDQDHWILYDPMSAIEPQGPLTEIARLLSKRLQDDSSSEPDHVIDLGNRVLSVSYSPAFLGEHVTEESTSTQRQRFNDEDSTSVRIAKVDKACDEARDKLRTILPDLDRLNPVEQQFEIRNLLNEATNALSGLSYCFHATQFAFEDTLRMFSSVDWKESQVAHPLQWEKRLTWLKAEFAGVEPGRGGAEPAAKFLEQVDESKRQAIPLRMYFKRDASGLPAGWAEERDPTGEIRRMARLYTLIRESGGELLRLHYRAQESEADAQQGLIQFGSKLSLYSMLLHTLPVASTAPAQALLAFFDQIAEVAYETKTVSNVTASLAKLETMYATTLESYLPENRAVAKRLNGFPGINIRMVSSEESPVPLSLLKEAERIEHSLLIDLDLNEIQEGFARAGTAELFQEKLDYVGAQYFALRLGSENIGLEVLYTWDRQLPPSVAQPLQLLKDSGETAYRNFAWVDTLGITQAGRIACVRAGISSNDFLQSSAQESARALGLDMLFAKTRVGEQGNASLNSHKRLGWQDTGIEYRQSNGFDFRLLRLQIDKLQG